MRTALLPLLLALAQAAPDLYAEASASARSGETVSEWLAQGGLDDEILVASMPQPATANASAGAASAAGTAGEGTAHEWLVRSAEEDEEEEDGSVEEAWDVNRDVPTDFLW